MLTYKTQRASLFTYTIFEKMVPNDKLSRLDSLLDFSTIYDRARKYYCPDNDRPSHDPVVMFKILFLGFLYNISGEQNLLDEISDRASFRQFAGLDLTDDIPDRTTLVKFRMKLGLELIQNFFDYVLQQCINLNLVGFQNSVFDGTIIKARARFKRGRDQRCVGEFVKKQAKKYCQDYFEINNDETYVNLVKTKYPKRKEVSIPKGKTIISVLRKKYFIGSNNTENGKRFFTEPVLRIANAVLLKKNAPPLNKELLVEASTKN